MDKSSLILDSILDRLLWAVATYTEALAVFSSFSLFTVAALCPLRDYFNGCCCSFYHALIICGKICCVLLDGNSVICGVCMVGLEVDGYRQACGRGGMARYSEHHSTVGVSI